MDEQCGRDGNVWSDCACESGGEPDEHCHEPGEDACVCPLCGHEAHTWEGITCLRCGCRMPREEVVQGLVGALQCWICALLTRLSVRIPKQPGLSLDQYASCCGMSTENCETMGKNALRYIQQVTAGFNEEDWRSQEASRVVTDRRTSIKEEVMFSMQEHLCEQFQVDSQTMKPGSLEGVMMYMTLCALLLARIRKPQTRIDEFFDGMIDEMIALEGGTLTAINR